MLSYIFDASKYKEGYQLIPEGNHRVTIVEASEQTSKKSGLDMIKLVLSIAGYPSRIFHYLTIDTKHMEIVHQKFGELFESFNIQPGDMDVTHWIGRTGAARVKHGEYKGEAKAEVARFLSQRQQEEMGLSAVDGEFTPVRDNDNEDSACPF